MKWEMDYRTAYKAGVRMMGIGSVPFLAGGIGYKLSRLPHEDKSLWLWMFGIGGAVFFLGLIVLWTWFNCPKCGKNLVGGRGAPIPKYCPHCGEKLDVPKPWGP